MKKSIVSVLLLCQLASASTEFTYLEQGTPAPFAGYLITAKKEKELRLLNESFTYCDKSRELLTKLNTDNENILKLQSERIAIRDQQVDTLSQRLVESKDDGFLSKIGFFLLGALVTTGIAYGVSKTLR